MKEQEKLLRGKVLDFLRYLIRSGDKDGEIEELGIISVFYQYYKVKSIREALHYLESKGYITSREILKPTSNYEKYKLYKITAAGIDVLDGTVQDNGIILGEE